MQQSHSNFLKVLKGFLMVQFTNSYEIDLFLITGI